MPNLIPQNLLVWKSITEVVRITLQPNIPNSGIFNILPQRFGFLPYQQELIYGCRACPTITKDIVFHTKSTIHAYCIIATRWSLLCNYNWDESMELEEFKHNVNVMRTTYCKSNEQARIKQYLSQADFRVKIHNSTNFFPAVCVKSYVSCWTRRGDSHRKGQRWRTKWNEFWAEHRPIPALELLRVTLFINHFT